MSAPVPGAPLLEARGLGFAFPDGPRVLSGVDLVLRAGCRTAVLGPNGGGKTTLLRLLVGALEPTDGQVLLDGRPVRRRDRDALREAVQLVLQDPGDQLFAATVYADVSFGPVNLGLPEAQVRERVDAALAALSVTDLADRPTHLLSHGQQKRVAVAGAVAVRPRLLVLDEPTAGLDPEGTEELLALLGALEAAGTTVVLTTHDVDLAWRWAREAVLVVDGGVVTAGAEALLQDTALLARARLRPPWGPAVSRLLGRDVRTATDLPA